MIAATLLIAWAPLLTAQTNPSNQQYSLSIVRGPLTAVLDQFSKQTGLQIGAELKTPELQEREVGPLEGRITANNALDELLAGSELKHVWEDRFTIRVFAGPVAPHAEGYAKNAMTVTGTRLSGWDSAAPVRTYRRDDIERFGASSLPSLSAYMTQQPYSQNEWVQLTGAQHFQLRGLGVDTTLVLINGRRVPASATSVSLNAFDLNTIPITAVDRIEVMSDSASAIYGADAIGGVVNVILKKSVESPEVYVHYGAPAGGGEERRIAGSIGSSSEHLKTSLILDYLERGMLIGAERDMWRNQDYTRFGGIDYRVPTANPANVYSLSGGPLPGLSTSQASVPRGSSGIGLRPEDFLRTAGVPSLHSYESTRSVVPGQERLSAFGSAELTWGQKSAIFGEVLASSSEVVAQGGMPSLSQQIVSGENPYNPFGEDVLVDYALAGMEPLRYTADSEFTRFVLGARGEIPRGDWELTLINNEEGVTLTRINDLDPSRVRAALNSTDPQSALNPFIDGPAGSKALLSSLLAVPQPVNFSSDMLQLAGFVRRELFRMPGGASEFVLGGEWRREKIKFFDMVPLLKRRDVSSGFAEIKLPLLEELTLKMALRGDYYESAGDSVNPQYGLMWRPTRDWLVRAAYGTSFRPPSLVELYSPRSEFEFSVLDLQRGGSLSSARVSLGGNSDLENILGRSFTGGFIYTPSTWPTLEVGVHYWRVVMNNRVVLPRFTDLANMEAQFPDRVTRSDPTEQDRSAGWPGALESVDLSILNYGELETRGVDLDLLYRFDWTTGSLKTVLSTTWVDKYAAQDMNSLLPQNRVGIANVQGTIPEYRLVGSLVWEGRGWGASTTATFTPRYRDSGLAGVLDRHLPSRTLVDLQGWVELDRMVESDLLDGVKVTVGAINLFNRKADFANVGNVLGYDITQADLKERFTYARLQKKF